MNVGQKYTRRPLGTRGELCLCLVYYLDTKAKLESCEADFIELKWLTNGYNMIETPLLSTHND